MKDPIKTIESLNDIHLSSTEKADIFSHIQHHIDAHPAIALPSPYAHFNIWSLLHRHAGYATAAAFLLALAGSSAAAESALPGDVLYSFKRSVNENVMQALAFGDTAEAEVHIKLVERRFEEVEQILAQEHTNDTTLLALATDIQEHTNNALEQIDTVRNETSIIAAVDLANDLSSTIVTHDSFIDSEDTDTALAAPEEVSLFATTAIMEPVQDVPMAMKAAVMVEETPDLQSIIEQAKQQAEMMSFDLSNEVSLSEAELVTNEDIEKSKEKIKDMLTEDEVSTSTKEYVESLIESAEENAKNNNFNDAFIILEEAEKHSEQASAQEKLQKKD